MRLTKIRRKWAFEGEGTGWIYERKFDTKWGALLAREVFESGGRVSDYWRSKRGQTRPPVIARKALEEVERAFNEILEMDPTPEEIEEYGERAGYGAVTHTSASRYFSPHLHNTWGKKFGGRVHIDIGSGGVHLMLDRHNAWDFVNFIKDRRLPKKDVPTKT